MHLQRSARLRDRHYALCHAVVQESRKALPFRCGNTFSGILSAYSHKSRPESKADHKVDQLDDNKGAAGMGEQREHTMPILYDGACEENAERYQALGEHRDKNQVRAGLGNDPDKTGNPEDDPLVLLDSVSNLPLVDNKVQKEHCTKRPQKDARDMPAHHVPPEVVFEEVIGNRNHNEHSYGRDNGKRGPDPIPCRWADLTGNDCRQEERE